MCANLNYNVPAQYTYLCALTLTKDVIIHVNIFYRIFETVEVNFTL